MYEIGVFLLHYVNMELVKLVETVLWAGIVELVMVGTGYGTTKPLIRIYQSESEDNYAWVAYLFKISRHFLMFTKTSSSA